MKKVKVKESKIDGLGLFTDQEFNEGDIIGLAHYNGVPSEIIGKYHNHSDNPNAHSVSIGNKRYLAALRPLKKGEEITINYRQQPELEQPEEFRKGGLVSMPKPSKKGLASKRYSRDLTATNRLLTKNKLLQKPKSKKRRIYDPNAKYYQDGGTSNSKNNFYTVQGSDGVYRKAGSNWEVDWNRSGNFQPLSKGDVAKRTAVLNSQAKPLYDPIYDDTYATRQSAYTAPVKPTPAKKPTAQDKAAQEQFDKNFQVTGKSKMEVVEDKILQDQQNYIQHAKEKGYEATQEELDQLEERGWVQYGNVGASPNPYSMKQAGPAEKPQEFWDKAGDIISNPMTSAGFLMRGQEIPDYMQRNMDRGTFGYYSNGVFHTERNPLDFAVADMTGLGLVNDARQTYQGIANKDVAQAGLGALGFIPGMTELKNVGKAVNAVDAAKSANKAIEFAGPMKHSYQDVPEALNALRQRGAYWDKTGATGKDLLHPDMINYHGTYAGRPLVEVKMPDGSSEMFYKSSGWAGKQGAGANGTTEGMWQIFGGHADTPKTSNWFIKDQDYQNYYGSKTFGNMAENMDNALIQKLNFKSVDELDNAFNFQNRFGDVDSYTPKKQMGGTVELDGYRFKKDASGNWTHESGAPVTDRGMIQRLTYEAKPVGSPVVQSRPKPSLDKPVNNYTTINKLKNSPVLADQEKVKQAESLALEELVYNPVVPNIRSKEDFPNDVEGLIDEALNFPEARARIAAKAAVDPGEDPSDPFRHSNAARYTAESIKDYVADVPYQSIPFIGDAVNEYMDNYVAPGLGFLGANLLGLAHEASIFVRDARPVDIKYRESFEDMYNNYVGAKTGASDMSPEAKTNYLLYLNRTNRLPDGVVPKPGSNKNLYIKSGPNDPGKYKSSYQKGGESRKIKFQPGTYNTDEMAGYMKEEPEVIVSAQASPWGKARLAYQKRNPEEEFIEKKKRQYIRQSNKGLNKLFGINTENFNPDVEQNFRDEYDYLTNTAAVREVARQEGWNPNKRKEYVDDLNETQRQIVANSKYGSKLQPNYWDRALAGVATLVSPFSSGVQRMMNEGYMPGLTKEESQAILNSEIFGIPMGGAEILTPLTLQGQNLANYVKNRGLSTGSDYKELPAFGSGESMANVDDTDAMGLDLPGLIELGFAPQAGVKLMQGLYKGAKQLPGAINASKESGLLSNTYKVNPFAFKPDPSKFYRQIGNIGLEDALSTQTIRSADQLSFPRPYFVEGKDFKMLEQTGTGAHGRPTVVFETPGVTNDGLPFVSPANASADYTPWIADMAEVPLTEGRLLKQNWLRGYKEVPRELPGSPNAIDNTQELTGFSIGSGGNLTKEVPNPDFYSEIMKINKYSPSQKKYFESLIASVKNQGNVATEKQFNELQRIRTGDYNYGKKGYSLKASEILKLPEEEILNKTGRSKEDWELFLNPKANKDGRYSKLLEEQFNSAYQPTDQNLQSIEQGKKQLLDFYGSSDYNRRLQEGLGIDFNDAYNYQNSLINAVNKTKPRFVQSRNAGTLESDAVAYTSGADPEGTKLGIDFSKRGLERTDAPYLASHEFGHTSIYDAKNQKLLDNLPKLELDSETLKLWESEAAKPGGESYRDMINYYSNPDEARQRGLNAILYSKNKGISIDELVDMPYSTVVDQNRAGTIPADVLQLRQIYNQKDLKNYLKKLFVIAGPILTNEVLQQEKLGGVTSKLNKFIR